MRIPDVLVADIIYPVCNGGKPDLVEAVFKNITDDVLVKHVSGIRPQFQILPIYPIVFSVPKNGIAVDKQPRNLGFSRGYFINFEGIEIKRIHLIIVVIKQASRLIEGIELRLHSYSAAYFTYFLEMIFHQFIHENPFCGMLYQAAQGVLVVKIKDQASFRAALLE